MLPERITVLLTAYIDGELSSRQRKVVTRLLRKSPEARKLLEEMQQDSLVLRKLPPKKIKQDLSRTLPGTIEMRGLKLPVPPSTPEPRRPATVPLWVALIGAVVVLGGVGFGSYLFFGVKEPRPTAPTTQQTSPTVRPPSTPATRSTAR